MPATSETRRVGVVLERRRIDHPWQPYTWRAVGVIPDAADVGAPVLLRAGPDWAQYHAATVPIELHQRETEGYKRNLSSAVPAVYVVLRVDDEDSADEMPAVFLATVCPYEAQDYLDSAGGGDEVVEPVSMPLTVRTWVRDYVERYHVDEAPKKKRAPRWFERHDEATGETPILRGKARHD